MIAINISLCSDRFSEYDASTKLLSLYTMLLIGRYIKENVINRYIDNTT